MNSQRRAQSVSPLAPDVQDAGLTSNADLLALAESGSEPFTPELILFADDSEESWQAGQVLVAYGEEFRTIPAKGSRIPALAFGGIVAERLSGVQGLVGALSAFDAAFRAGINEPPLHPTASQVMTPTNPLAGRPVDALHP